MIECVFHDSEYVSDNFFDCMEMYVNGELAGLFYSDTQVIRENDPYMDTSNLCYDGKHLFGEVGCSGTVFRF